MFSSRTVEFPPLIADASVTMPVRNGDRKRLKKVDVTFDDEKFHAFLSFPFAPAKKKNDVYQSR